MPTTINLPNMLAVQRGKQVMVQFCDLDATLSAVM
jgi:hypothetical protein